MAHNMTDHSDVDTVIQNCTHWEDADSWIIVGVTEEGGIGVTAAWKLEFNNAPTFLAALHQAYPKCYCDELGG